MRHSFLPLLSLVLLCAAPSGVHSSTAFFVTFSAPPAWQPVAAADLPLAFVGDFLVGWSAPVAQGPGVMYLLGTRKAGMFLTEHLARSVHAALEAHEAQSLTLSADPTIAPGSYEVSCLIAGTGLIPNLFTEQPGATPTYFAVTLIPHPWQDENQGKDVLLAVLACPAERREALHAAYRAFLASLSFTGRYAPPPPPPPQSSLWHGFLRIPGQRSVLGSRRLALAVGVSEAPFTSWRLPLPPDGDLVLMLLSEDCQTVWVLPVAEALKVGRAHQRELVLNSRSLRPYLSAWHHLLAPPVAASDG